VIKYSVVTPNAGLLAFYFITFVLLFIARDSFKRGATPLTWRLRLKDLAYMVGGLLLAAFAALMAVDRDNRASIITSRAIDNFTDYIAAHGHAPKGRLTAVLLAHSISAFILAAAVSILWILFRPNKFGIRRGKDYDQVQRLLSKYSSSSEDFFKIWPRDKNFYWNKSKDSFVAYRVVGSTAFGLADPIGKNSGALAKEFNEWCHSRSLKTCFLPVYEGSKKMYQSAGLELMQIGSSAEITIDNFLDTTVKDKWWRWKLNRAKKDGYSYSKSTPPHSSDLMRQLKTISDAWLNLGGHAERGFALGYYDQEYLKNCTIHYLVDNIGRVSAFTNELPQFNGSHIMTIDLLRYAPEAKNSMPLLLSSVIEDANQRKSDIRIFDLGFVPFAKSKGPLLAIAKAFSRDRFSSRGLEQFKNKFNPDWRPNYMAYDGDLADLAIIALSIEKLMERQ
ncbi:MAG: bifunctional lysylphosphatidylglycerol flippase/synthetase MprF, partial [Candidatus Saccharimonadales bacterium]